MTTSYVHVSVLQEEVIEALAPRPGGVYCDGTVGGGGHAERILEASAPDGRLIGIDRDPAALAAAAGRLGRFGPRVTLLHGRFGASRELLEPLGVLPLDGVLLDLGISSPQVDHPERGFSFQKSGPLDMRMDPTTDPTLEQLLARWGVDELRAVLDRFGEEPYAGKIARAIKQAHEQGQLATTTALAEVVARALPMRERTSRKTDPATRTFQALRIAVNQELDDVQRFLAELPTLLVRGGRVAVIAFHSLEDRLVKDRLRDLSRHPGLPPDIAAAMGVRSEPEMALVTRKPVFPSAAEVATNPRARSARLRAARRL